MTLADCPSCEHKTDNVWGSRDGYSIFLCMDCGLYFFDRKQLPIMPNDYQGYYDYLHTFDDERFSYEIAIRRRRMLKQLGEIENYAMGKRLIDIGAGTGYFCYFAQQCGFDVTAVEVSETARTYGRQKLGVKYSDLEAIPDNAVDVVICNHVIEHVMDPRGFLKNIASKLSQNGIISIQVPNCEPLTFYLKNLIDEYGVRRGGPDKACALYYPDHLTGFTRSSLAYLLNNLGFESIKGDNVGPWSMYYDPFFLRNVWSSSGFGGVVKKALRGAIDTIGCLVDKGDWVHVIYRRPSSLDT